MGALVGHVWWFFEDVFPPIHNGYRPFDPPRWWQTMWEGWPVVEEPEQEQEQELEPTAVDVQPPPERAHADIAPAEVEAR